MSDERENLSWQRFGEASRELATVIMVSQVEFSRSPAVESIAGCMAPTASMMMKKIGNAIVKTPT